MKMQVKMQRIKRMPRLVRMRPDRLTDSLRLGMRLRLRLGRRDGVMMPWVAGTGWERERDGERGTVAIELNKGKLLLN